MSEEWKPIPGYEGLYEVSSFGRVKSLRSNKLLKGRKVPSGYLRVRLPAADGQRDKYIHRLVADAFCLHPYGCDVVNHRDNDVQNNRADNLEWTTQRGNVMHAMDQGRVPNFPNAKYIIGERDGHQYIFRSYHEAAEFAGIDHKTVYRWCKMKRRDSRGFLWKEVPAA